VNSCCLNSSNSATISEMQVNEHVKQLYNEWHEKNRERIIDGHLDLANKGQLMGNDHDRGLNLISYIPTKINKIIDEKLLPKLETHINKSGWIVPPEGRHITILDVIPHNSKVGISTIHSLTDSYSAAIERYILRFPFPVEIRLQGVFASPNGITIQGFPIENSLAKLRDAIRQTLLKQRLPNKETAKYILETAHVSIIKFVEPLDGKKILGVVDQLRDFPIGTFLVREIVLNISGRYDKSRSIEVVKKFKIKSYYQ
jgi:hypothetical protein